MRAWTPCFWLFGFLEGHARAIHGTAHRFHPGKTEVRIFDYVDRDVPMLLRMFEMRLRGYRAIGHGRGEAPLSSIEPKDDIVVEYEGAM